MEKIFNVGDRVYVCISSKEGDKLLSGKVNEITELKEYFITWDSCVGCAWVQTFAFPANTIYATKNEAIDVVLQAQDELVFQQEKIFRQLVERVKAEKQKLLDMRELGTHLSSHSHIHSPTCEDRAVMKTVEDQHVSVRWDNFAGGGASQVAKKLGITFNDWLLMSLEDWLAFQELVFEERENDRAIRMINF